MVRVDFKPQIRLDKISELMRSLDANLIASSATESVTDDLCEKVSRKDKQSSFRCKCCHKTIVTQISPWKDTFSARSKKIKAYLSQLIIYGVTAKVQWVCSECNENKGEYIQAELKDSTNSRYVISSNDYSEYFWEKEVELILALHNFSELYDRLCTDNHRVKREVYKSRRAKLLDDGQVIITKNGEIKIAKGTRNSAKCNSDADSSDEIESILRAIQEASKDVEIENGHIKQ